MRLSSLNTRTYAAMFVTVISTFPPIREMRHGFDLRNFDWLEFFWTVVKYLLAPNSRRIQSYDMVQAYTWQADQSTHHITDSISFYHVHLPAWRHHGSTPPLTCYYPRQFHLT
jgi:hypothetical protein